MEYVLLLAGMVVFVKGVAFATYDYRGRGSFGVAARPVVQLYQRIVSMISLPVP